MGVRNRIYDENMARVASSGRRRGSSFHLMKRQCCGIRNPSEDAPVNERDSEEDALYREFRDVRKAQCS